MTHNNAQVLNVLHQTYPHQQPEAVLQAAPIDFWVLDRRHCFFAVIVPVWRLSSQTKPTNGFSYRINKVPTSCQGQCSLYSNSSYNHRAICHTVILPSATLQTQTYESFIWAGNKNETITLFSTSNYRLISRSKVGTVPCQTFIHHSCFFLLLWAQKCLFCLIDSLLNHRASTR